MPRYTMEVGKGFEKVLRELSEDKETTRADVLRRAISVYKYLSDETKNGRNVAILDENDALLKVVILP